MSILERFFLRDEWSRNPGGAWKRSAGIAILWLLLGALLAFFNWIGSIGYFFVGVLWGLGALYAFRKGRQRQQERRDNCVHNGPRQPTASGAPEAVTGGQRTTVTYTLSAAGTMSA